MSSSRRLRRALWILLILCGICAVFGYGWYVLKNTARVPEESPTISDSMTAPESEVEEKPTETVQSETEAPKPIFDTASLQAGLDTWNTQSPGNKSVVVMSLDGTVLASVNKDQTFFAASIYKLYVAYFGYKQIEAGQADPQQQYINGHTRSQCLDLMIRESDSPCAEKMWAELGKPQLTEKLSQIGITNTSMSNISTTAIDAATMMAFIARGEGLTPASQASFLESAREQIYRDALNKGFSANVTVYNKVGFKELVEYHDVAIVELKDGRKFIVSVLTESVGTKRIAELGQRLEALVQL